MPPYSRPVPDIEEPEVRATVRPVLTAQQQTRSEPEVKGLSIMSLKSPLCLHHIYEPLD